MASALAEAHIEAERRLRLLITGQVGRIWRELPAYDRPDIDQWLTRVLPVIAAGRHASASLTDGYLARALDRAPLGIDPDALEVRLGTDLSIAYERPFVTVWSALGSGALYEDAVNSGLARATGMAAFDVQGAMARAAQAIGTADNRIQRYQRVADGSACDFCVEVDGAILNSDDVLPLHNFCGCSIEPLTEAAPITPTPETVAVHEHGELGPVLGDPAHDFTHLVIRRPQRRPHERSGRNDR